VLICSERKVLLASCWWLVICSERKVLMADKLDEQGGNLRHMTIKKLMLDNVLVASNSD
jgi:hypothetical protein